MTASIWSYALGYLTGVLAFGWFARSRKLLTGGILILLTVGLISGLVGANLAQWVVGGSAGKTVLGAIVFGYLGVFAAKKLLGIKRPLGDLFAVGISAGEAVGRWGCFFGGCCFGKTCSLPWAVHQHDALRHPTQIYLSLANLAILIVLLAMDRFKPPENTLFYLQGMLYCLARFFIEFLRDSPSHNPLTSAQFACIAGLVFFAFMFIRLISIPPVQRIASL